MINVDEATEQRVPPTNTTGAKWSGITLYARYKINDTFEPSVRLEDYRDPDGFTTGGAQKLNGYTVTLNTRILVGNLMLLIRPELRYDVSDTNFFSRAVPDGARPMVTWCGTEPRVLVHPLPRRSPPTGSASDPLVRITS